MALCSPFSKDSTKTQLALALVSVENEGDPKMWEYVFDNDYMQRRDIGHLKRQQDIARRRQRLDRKKSNDRVEELEMQIGELALVCRTLVEMLVENGSLDPKRFEEIRREIDLEDGVLDGAITPENQRPRTAKKNDGSGPVAPRKRKRRS